MKKTETHQPKTLLHLHPFQQERKAVFRKVNDQRREIVEETVFM
jgi:hypothetical protein